RRHTRFSRDWSSDVCSSDLAVSKVSSYTAAREAVAVANLADAAAKGMVKASQTDPGQQLGRIWLVLNGDGQMVGVQVSNGSTWEIGRASCRERGDGGGGAGG